MKLQSSESVFKLSDVHLPTSFASEESPSDSATVSSLPRLPGNPSKAKSNAI